LCVPFESVRQATQPGDRVKFPFGNVAKWRVTDVMCYASGFDYIWINVQAGSGIKPLHLPLKFLRYAAPDLSDLKRMG
jgi:hypothetical protein